MTKIQITKTVRVFISSPGDVEKYRSVLRKIIDDLNADFLDICDYSIELIEADKDVPAGYGKDAQSQINQHIKFDYEILFAIFGFRIGTQTQRAISGSAEEIERAIANYSSHGSPDVMVYFSQDEVNPWKLDMEQFANLRKFREKLRSGEKIYYKDFKGEEHFSNLIKKDLKNKLRIKMDEDKTRKAIKPTDIDISGLA